MKTGLQKINYKTKEHETHTVISFDTGKELGISNENVDRLIKKDGLLFKDMNGSGRLEAYKDWRLPNEIRAKDLASKISIDTIAGLMLYSRHQTVLEESSKYESLFGKNTYAGKEYDSNVNSVSDLTDQQRRFLVEDQVRHVLLSSVKDAVSSANWSNNMQAFAEAQGWGIPVCISSDPRHGNKGDAEYNLGAGGDTSKWPENIGLAATFDSEIVFEFGKIMSKEYRAMGINMALGPQIDLVTDPRWSRIAGTFGESSELTAKYAQAFIDGCQSTFDDAGNDIGWGRESVATICKHWPGGGTGEGGRDAHYNYGKYAVYPGNNFEEHLIPFTEGAFKLTGKTKQSAGVMPYYTISYDQSPEKENVGNSYSRYIVKDLLREKYQYTGIVCSDWLITDDSGPKVETFSGKCWGVEGMSIPERHLEILLAGVDQFGGNNDIKPVLEAFRLGCLRIGEKEMEQLFRACAFRILLNMFNLELFDNPYVDIDETKKVVGCEEFVKAGRTAQEKSVILLKNQNNLLPISVKKKVYIPEKVSMASKDWFGNKIQGKNALPIRKELVEEFFQVVDSPEEADFSLVLLDSPKSAGYSPKNGYIPISLQYRPYQATLARTISIAGGDPLEKSTNRSYYNKNSEIENEADLNCLLETIETMKGKPVIAVLNLKKPMILKEFEKEIAAIIAHFDANPRVLLELVAGTFEPSGRLPFQMPKDMQTVETQMEDVPFDMDCHRITTELELDFGYGLNWRGQIVD